MSRIEKLSIQGIRSFGPEEKRRIEFCSPLTLILGQNGCGKTTIIEALKYIATGDMPPGCGRGGSFVHDPKLAKEATVRGQIKLLFRDIRGQELVTTRSIEATQKAKRPECRTLDATLQKLDSDGSKITLSSKCSDFEALMVSSLGVSKPILNNVIFCHQEDSNWPLDEGKKVKEKFDAIFNATKYTKCLETIRKLRLEMKAKVKNMQDILVELKKWKDEANRKRSDLRSSEGQQTDIKNEKQKLKAEMEPILQRLKEICNIEDDIGQIRGELSGKKHELDSLRKTQEELRATLTEHLSCSDEELFHMIEDFQRDLALKEAEQKRVESQMYEAERGVQQKQGEVSKAVRQQGELEAAHNRHKNEIQKRSAMLNGIVEEYTFQEFMGVDNFKDEQAESALLKLLNVVEEERKTTLKKKEEFEEQETKIQADVDSLRSREAALDHEIRSKGKQLEDITRKIRQIKQTLMRNESDLSVANLDEIKEELKQVEQTVTAEEEKFDVKKVLEDIDVGKKTRREIELSVDEIKRVVAKMNRQAEARSQYDIHVKDRKELENKVEYLKRKHADELEHLLGEIPDDNVKHRVDACTTRLMSHISDLRHNIDALNTRKAQLDTSIRGHKQQMEKKEKDIKDLERKIDSTCLGIDLDKALDKSKRSKEDLTRERGELSSSITVLNRFTEKLRQRDCCPLCHRDFSTKDEVNQLIEELETKVSSVPGKLKLVKEKLDEQEKIYDQMVQLKPQREQANQARVELDRIQNQMDSETKELEKVNADLEGKTEMLEITQADEETARLIQGDVITIDNHLKKIKQLKDHIDDLQSTLGSSDIGMSMDEAIVRQNELEDDLRKSQNKVEELQEQLQEHKDRLQGLKDRKLRLSQQELNLKTKLQETEKLKEEIVKLEQDRSHFEEERDQAQAEVAPYKFQIIDETSKKTKITQEKESWIEAQNTKVNVIREKHKSLNDLHKSIVTYVSDGEENRLRQSRERVTSLQENVTSLETHKKSLEEKNRSLQKEITNHRERKRSLEDEKKIRDKEVEAKQLMQSIAKYEERIRGFRYESLIEEKDELHQKYSRMQNNRATLDGRLEEVQKTIRLLEGEIRRKEIQDADKNYKEKFVQMKCTDVAADDLNKYYKALDTAVMRDHAHKMGTINSIVRELWRTTYKGNDIDYVEVKTDETESQGTDKRRTYNYRVVMVKNQVEMDMRGRCSAGQKVLACLIIRMALGETFSSNCGILALDEPTTNLDRKNIDALSSALLSIVKKRSHQRNFQLIIITHDADFLGKMTHTDDLDHYFKLSRNEKGLSTITRCDKDSL